MNNKNLFSIGEMAKSIGITRKIILNYEAKGLITPDEKDGATGNRYYTIDTFTQIRTIRLFQNLGFSLDEIRDYFNDTADLMSFIKRLEAMRDDLNSSIERLYERAGKDKNQIRKIKVEAQTVYIQRRYTHSTDARSVILRETALEAMRRYETDISRRMYFIEYPLSDPDDLTYAVSVASKSEGEHIIYIPSFMPFHAFITARMRIFRAPEKNCAHMQKKIKSKFPANAVIFILKGRRSIRTRQNL